MHNFKCLYNLENFDFWILEIKRTDLGNDALAAEQFKWLKINKEDLAIIALHFSSMDSAGTIEERYFQEGYLKFDHETGTFIEKYNSAQYSLTRMTDLELSSPVAAAIADFLATNKVEA
jgi:hypothetical protein